MPQTWCDTIYLLWRKEEHAAQDETVTAAGVAVEAVDKPVYEPLIPLPLWLNRCWHAKELQLSQIYHWAPP